METVPQELWLTSRHEAGHVLCSILYQRKILRWSLDRTLWKPNPSEKCNQWGHVYSRRDLNSIDEYISAFTGRAAEGAPTFAEEDDVVPEATENWAAIMATDTDFYGACWHADRILREHRKPWRSSNVQTAFEETYAGIQKVFAQQAFSISTETIAEYMIERVSERGKGINDRLMHRLHLAGITHEHRRRMRRVLDEFPASAILLNHVPNFTRREKLFSRVFG